jgi:hypothetical protein
MVQKNSHEIEYEAPSPSALTNASVRKSIQAALKNDHFVSMVRDALVRSGQTMVSNKHQVPPPPPGAAVKRRTPKKK